MANVGGQNGTMRGGHQTPFIAGQMGSQLVRGPSPAFTSHEEISQANRVPTARGHNGLSTGQGLTRVQTSLVRGQTSLRRGLISPSFRGQQLLVSPRPQGRPFSGGTARLSNGQSSSTSVPMMQNGGVQVQRGQSSRSRFYSGPVTSVGSSGRGLPRLPIQQEVTTSNQQTKEGGGQRGHHSQVGKSLVPSTRGRGGLWQASVAPGCAPTLGGALPTGGRGGHAGRRLFRSVADKLSPRQRYVPES
jgi:hypothetical protein